jgi:hydroxymethylbilane synthase
VLIVNELPKPLTPGPIALQSAEIRVGTRGSPLALAQAEETRAALAAALGIEAAPIAVMPIRTSGDRVTDRPIAEAGGKGLFTKEIDEALLDGRIDVGVHSAKDLPTDLPEGIVIAACLKRHDVRDAFISMTAKRLGDLPKGAVVGTSSLRRKALVLRTRPDLVVVNLRGNVDTRLRKIADGEAAATLLAAAGLARLGLSDRVASFMEVDAWLPAPGQGAIAIAAREDDTAMRERLKAIDDHPTSIALSAERAFLGVLDGSCRTPIGGLARIEDEYLSFRGIIIKPDGSDAHEVRLSGPVRDAVTLGIEAGAQLAERSGPEFFADG